MRELYTQSYHLLAEGTEPRGIFILLVFGLPESTEPIEMRLNGEEGKEIDRRSLQQQQQQKLIVGYALTSKKIKSFLQPKLEGLAR